MNSINVINLYNRKLNLNVENKNVVKQKAWKILPRHKKLIFILNYLKLLDFDFYRNFNFYTSCVLQHSHLVEVVKQFSSGLFFIYYSAMHTTHATQLFLDVTGHVSRTRVYACKHISRCASTRRLCLYFYCIAKKRNCAAYCKSTEKCSSVYRYIPDASVIFILSHLSFWIKDQMLIQIVFKIRC